MTAHTKSFFIFYTFTDLKYATQLKLESLFHIIRLGIYRERITKTQWSHGRNPIHADAG